MDKAQALIDRIGDVESTNLSALLSVKRELIALLGVDQAFDAYRTLGLPNPPLPGARWGKLSQLHDVAPSGSYKKPLGLGFEPFLHELLEFAAAGFASPFP